jgi:1-acyl-sn-glycerol-3-phosphate acyltransferase
VSRSEHFRGRPYSTADAPKWRAARFLRPTVAKLFLLVWKVRIIDSERIPAGGAILAGNHLSYLDPILLWCAAPRPVHFMAKIELWSVKPLGWMLDRLWAFPVNRHGADRDAISTATALLQAGEPVGMFPEGTRQSSDSAQMGEAHNGVSFIAMRAGVPVVPLGFSGTDKAWPRGKKLPRPARVTICVGEPVFPEEFEGGRKERVAAMTAEVMRRVEQQRIRSMEV